MTRRTSLRACSALAALAAGYLALAVVAGVPRSPLTVPLPAGARPPAWTAQLAAAAHLAALGRHGLIALAWALVLAVLAAFAVVVGEAWSGRVRLRAVLTTAAVSLGISVAAPVLLSRDVYTYAAYGRIEALHHRDPYTVTLSSFPHDPFVAVASAQWWHTHSIYGPLFTLVSAAIVRLFAGTGATILAFKVLAGAAIALATGLAALTARRVRPERAPLAAALVGLNPVLVIHTVGGAHVDALIAAPLAAAMPIAVTRPRAGSARAFAVTLLLTVACLVKVAVVPALALWLAWTARESHDRRLRTLGVHAALIVAATAVATAPFAAGRNTLTPFATLGGIEAWASPSHLVGRAAQAAVAAVAGARAGADAAVAVEIAFLLVFGLVASRLGHRAASDPAAPADEWGVALLLLALSMPFLLPWYAAWFAPFLGLLKDGVLVAAGALTAAVLGLTLIPADPFHGLTTPAVMEGVHYGAASALLVALVVVAARVGAASRAAPSA